MLTWSDPLPLAHGPLSTVHSNTFTPTGNPVTCVFGSLGSTMVPPPLTSVHVPVAGNTGVDPVRVTLFGTVGTQMFWSGPTVTAGCVLEKTKSETRSLVLPLAQGPFSTVQRNTFSPTARPVMVVVGLLVLRQALFGHIAHERGFELDWPAVAWVGGGLLVQLWLVEWLGWIVATALLFLAGTLAFQDRRVPLNLAIGLVLAGLTFWIFNDGLGLSLPVGTVFEDLLAGDEPAE